MPNRERSDISDATEPAQWRLPGQNGPGATGKGPRSHIAFSFCMPRGDGVDANLARRQFESQSPGQGFDGALRGRVE